MSFEIPSFSDVRIHHSQIIVGLYSLQASKMPKCMKEYIPVIAFD